MATAKPARAAPKSGAEKQAQSTAGSTARATAGKSRAKKSTSNKVAAKKSTAKPSTPSTSTKKSTAKKSTAKVAAKKPTPSTTAKKSTAKVATRKSAPKTTAKKTAAKKTTAKKSTAKKSTAKKSTAKKSTAKKSTAKKTAANKPAAKKLAARRVRDPSAGDWLVDGLAPLRALADAVADLGVWVVDAETSTEAGDALREYYAEGWHLGVLWSEPLWDACVARVEPLRLWAEAEAMQDGRGGAVTPAFYLDPADPSQLWYAPSPELPAALFVPLPATREAVERAVNELGPRTRPVELAEQRTVRAYMGALATLQVPSPYSGELEQAGPHELDRHFNFSPAVTPHAWGSAYVADPLEGQKQSSTFESMIALRAMREQEEDAVPRFTRRAQFSRAHVAMEIHAGGHYFWEIRYRPSLWTGDVITRFNAITDHDFPADLPVDAAAAIHGFLFLDADQLAAALAKETVPGMRGALVSAALGVALDDIGEAGRLARAAFAAGGPEALAAIDAALQYNWQFLVEEFGVTTDDAEVREQLESFIADGLGPPAVDEHGEPLDMYGDADDDEHDLEEAEDDDA